MTILDVIKWVVDLSAWFLIPYFLFLICVAVLAAEAKR